MSIELHLPSLEATQGLARAIADRLAPGDTVGLAGGLGVGKSAFARAAIGRLLAVEGRAEDIPSPSYTLVQVYDVKAAELWHADLYRLGDISEIDELGLQDAFNEAICLVEWADRLGARAPEQMMTCALDFAAQDDARIARLSWSDARWDWLAELRTEAGVL